MKNRGIGKFEGLTLIVLIMVISAYLLWYILGGVNSQKYTTMKKKAISFGKTVSINDSSFHNTEYVYLKEVMDEGLISNMKSPFSNKDCSMSESKVVYRNDLPKVTLKCDNYVIDNLGISDNDYSVYKVGDWGLEIPKDNYEEKVLYNCIENGKEKYPEYYEELYFVLLVNKDYGTNHFLADNIENECEVVSKTFYRTKEKIK